MDQPQQDDTTVNTDNQGPDVSADQATPISVNFTPEPNEASSYQGDGASTQQDPVTDGVPNSEGSSWTPEVSNEQMLESAEEQIKAADPQSINEELAIFESEIVAEQQEPVATENITPSGGSDPMDQIMSRAEESNAEVISEPAEAETTEIPSGEIESDQELANGPDSHQDTSSEPLTESTEASTEASESAEPSVTDPIPVTMEPNAFTQAPIPQEENSSTSDNGALINDVFMPTAVAAAAASGSSGANAITGTPEPSTIESSQDAMLTNQKVQQAHKPKSSKGKLVAVVVLVTLLLAGGSVAAYMFSQKSNDDTKQPQNTSEEVKDDEKIGDSDDVTNTSLTSRPGDKVEAVALDDYKAACGTGGLVTNATAYAGVSPHKIAIFEKGSDDKFALSLISFKDKTWSADPANVTSGQLVGCIARKVASEVKLKSCPITDSTTKVTTNVDFYSTKYTVDVVEAKTGKKVTSFENSSTSTTCPTAAVYNKADPKIFAGFDLITLEASLKDSVTKTI